LIPAGTGLEEYRTFRTVAPDYEPMDFYTSEDEQDPAEWLATLGAPEAGGETASVS